MDTVSSLSVTLRTIDYDALPISDYSRRYIRRMLPALDYYLGIYAHGLETLLRSVGKPAEELTLVDYGGGHGFLSILAKQAGVGQVIYVDFNPDAVATIHAVSDYLATLETPVPGPDVVLQGDSKVLGEWCAREKESPDIVMGMDVIEHIYCLDDFFGHLFVVGAPMRMLFTTASNPYNRRVVRKLHKVMAKDEALFFKQRREFIQKHYPDMDSQKLDYWATNTRGLNYDDILRAVDTESPNLLRDPFNTCDPETGSWTERILPLDDYRNLLMPYGYEMCVENGWYNSANTGLKGCLERHYNKFLKAGRRRNVAPFLFLYMQSTTL